MAKMTRERLVKEKREKKREKKEARAAEKARIAAGLPPEGELDETDAAPDADETDEAPDAHSP